MIKFDESCIGKKRITAAIIQTVPQESSKKRKIKHRSQKALIYIQERSTPYCQEESDTQT
jgi:hypothetical protein